MNKKVKQRIKKLDTNWRSCIILGSTSIYPGHFAMPRKRGEWNEERFKQYVKEGRGQNNAENYLPWIKVQEFSSRGRVSRTKGWKTNRLHHLFSDHETRLFYLLEWSDIVIDIREQFPLLDLELARKISADIGVRYPIDSQSRFPHILTTDFMVTVNQSGKVCDVALTVKPSAELKKKRVIEKFDIERNYYAAKDIEWRIVTEKHIPKSLAKNIEWIHGAHRLEATSKNSIQDLEEVIITLKKRLQVSNLRISQVTDNLDSELGLEKGTSLYLFRHLVARKEIVVDMNSTKACPDILAKDIQKIVVSSSLLEPKPA